MEQSQAWSHPFSSSFLGLQVHTLWPTQRRSGFPLCLKRKEEKCLRVCRDDLQFSPAEADRMRLWAVPLPSMLLLFKMKRRLRKGRTTRTEMCLVVSACTLCSWPGSSRPFTLVAVSNLILVFRRWVIVVARLEWNQCRSFFPIVSLYHVCLGREDHRGVYTKVHMQPKESKRFSQFTSGNAMCVLVDDNWKYKLGVEWVEACKWECGCVVGLITWIHIKTYNEE